MAEIIKIDFHHPQPALKNALNVLQNGGVVSFPTETFYGLGANALSEKAIEKVFMAKGRDFNKPLLVFIASKKQLSCITQNINATAKKLIESFWPGPLTLVFEVSPHLPKILTGNTGRIGSRVSGSKFIRQLCQITGFPITGSSANISNNPELVTSAEVMEKLGDKIDLILDGGKVAVTQSSTVLDVSKTIPKLIRPGIIGKDAIEDILNMPIK